MRIATSAFLAAVDLGMKLRNRGLDASVEQFEPVGGMSRHKTFTGSIRRAAVAFRHADHACATTIRPAAGVLRLDMAPGKTYSDITIPWDSHGPCRHILSCSLPWADINAFAYPPSFTAGQVGRNILTGPGNIWHQFSVSKQIPIGERLKGASRDHIRRQGCNGLRPKTGVFGQRKRGREYQHFLASGHLDVLRFLT